MLQLMTALASYIDAPQEHLNDHSVMPAFEGAAGQSQGDRLLIRSGNERPMSAYVAIRYRDHWFWIENDDWKTKRAMTAIMFMFTLAEGSSSERLPLVTIPAQ
jgi:hypothetical protein